MGNLNLASCHLVDLEKFVLVARAGVDLEKIQAIYAHTIEFRMRTVRIGQALGALKQL